MKRFVYYIALLPLVALCACSHDDIDDVVGPVGNGKITIAASLDDLVITRAADTQAERTVEHIDVFAVDASGNIDYYERNTMGNNGGSAEDGAGKLTLNAARRAKSGEQYVFEQGVAYKFYLVANATASHETMAALTTLNELEQLQQDETYDEGKKSKLHLTGTNIGTAENRPTLFLMDAVATDASGNSTWVVNPAEGNLSNLELTAELKRAAAKIIVNITQGPDVEFRVSITEGDMAQYDFYKLPCTTFVLPNDEAVVGINLIDTDPINVNEETFVWQYTDASDTTPRNENHITVTGYAYAHQWGNENLTNETSLILNIPMMWNEDSEGEVHKEAAAPNSWYKVPLSKNKLFERNKCYVVNITINAVGATNRSTAIELQDIEYETLEWQQVGVDVGDSSDDPEFLVLNTDLVEMYNVNFDSSSLSFSSSSPVTSVVLKDVYSQNTDGTFTSATDSYSAYYVNKFGVKTNLSNAVLETISASAEQGVLTGGINIISLIRQSSASEVRLALEALGEEPVVPTEPDAEGKPNAEDYLPNGSSSTNTGWENIDGWKQITTTTTTSYSFEGNACYKTTTTDKTYNNWGQTYHVEGYPNTSKEEYSDNKTTQYFALLNAWTAQHPEYQEYLEAKARYDAYQTTKTAIEESEDVAEETHYNTIRYLEFEVTNQQGLKATFRVMQYPTVYITNIQGWYSYRDDFGGTTYEKRGNRTTNNSYFASKVANEITSGNNKGLSSIIRYTWSNNSNNPNTSDVMYSAGNARMYHVKITATSAEYTLGKPRLDANGYTESSAENNKLVSPSFMLASQLGALSNTFSEIGPVRTHCQQYVEVYNDNNGNKVVLDDWRLPTRAELEIIIKYQYSSDAMDEVIRRQGYWCADGGQVTNPDGASGNGYLRCIRDAY